MSGPVYGAKRWVDIPDKAHVEAPDGWIVTSARAGRRISAVEIPPAEPVKDKLVSFARAVRGAESYPITAAQLVDDMALLEAVFASASSGKIQAVA
jgi:predicted dehydrogenase